MNISVVIPNYNGSQILKENLPQIKQNLGRLQYVIVDDASTDDSIEIIKGIDPQIVIVQKKINEGFASAVNLGIKHASFDLILLLNSDVIPDKDLLLPLIKHFTDTKVFAVGCLQYDIEENKKTEYGRGIGKFDKGFLYHKAGLLDKDNTLWVFGGAGLFRKSIWEKLGGMYNLYNPFYWEDIDLSYRALKSGYKLVFDTNSKVWHKRESSSIRSNYSQKFIKSIAYRNQFIFVWLNITDFIYILQHIIFLPYNILYAIIKFDTAFFIGLCLAVLKFLEVLKYRKMNRKLFLLKDYDILEKYQK